MHFLFDDAHNFLMFLLSSSLFLQSQGIVQTLRGEEGKRPLTLLLVLDWILNWIGLTGLIQG